MYLSSQPDLVLLGCQRKGDNPGPPPTDVADHEDPAFWEEIYTTAGTPPWESDFPQQMFAQVLGSRIRPPGRAAVICCGRGDDCRQLGRAGFEVVGFDFSSLALRQAGEKTEPADGSIEYLERDVLAIGHEFPAAFDLVLENKGLCTIRPDRRAEFTDSLWRLLKPGGRILALFFPLDGRTGGPPYGLTDAQLRQDFAPHFEFELYETPGMDSPYSHMSRLAILRKVG